MMWHKSIKTINFVHLAAFFCVANFQTTPESEKGWIDLKNITFTFECANKAIGFYADVQYDCQIFHMCDEEKRRIPHLCANDTSFNQEYRICDWSYNFDCTQAPKWYYLNELTYATDPPVDEDGQINY